MNINQSSKVRTFTELSSIANARLNELSLDQSYHDRLAFELNELTKQGSEIVYLNAYNDRKHFKTNPNCLLVLWLLGMVDDDPLLNRQTPLLCTVKASKVKEYKTQHGEIPFDFVKDSDMPDIDIDCLPEARDPIKAYAVEKYGSDVNDGYGAVCSVGTWQTYKFKSAIIDTAIALGLLDKFNAESYTKDLPENVDDLKEGGRSMCKGRKRDQNGDEVDCKNIHDQEQCNVCGSNDTEYPTIGKILAEHDILRQLQSKFPDIVKYAVNLIGKVRNMGMHAGALIITDRPLFGNIPLARSGKKDYWISMWSEGRNTQLSKFGYVKWDILGLKTLKYIFECCKLIEENRGISFGKNMSGWDDIDPTKNRRGHFFDSNGVKRYIELNDRHVIKLANELKTDSIFQFDTELAKSILANGVKSFDDLLFFNAAGHPGPMAAIPEAVKNRDDARGTWKKRLQNIHDEFYEILKDTYGIILWQEQLTALWQNIAGFTSPEAQDARKAVAKKWVDKLKPVKQKWIDGASAVIGKTEAEEWYSKMVTFGRYAFNKSHGVSYCLVAQACLWLKAHFAPEWWASVMSDCHPDKLVRYMGIARADGWESTEITYCGTHKPETPAKGVKFATVNLHNMTTSFTVTGDFVNQGLIGIKGIGDSAAKIFAGKETVKDIDSFIEKNPERKQKTVFERFIKLGAFRNIPGHENAAALWQWYRYKYCTGTDITKLRREINAKLLLAENWNEVTIQAEIDRQISEYKKRFPKRHKIPPQILNYKPTPRAVRSTVMALFPDDFTLTERLKFQLDYLGYYIDSPLDLYKTNGGCTIDDAKKLAIKSGELVDLEVVILDFKFAETKTGKDYVKLFVGDGIQRALVFIWQSELVIQDAEIFVVGVGVRLTVKYDEQRSTFMLGHGETIMKLHPVE